VDAERWSAVRAQFEDLVDLDPSARAARLARLAESDEDLAKAVEQLLAADADHDTRQWALDPALRHSAFAAQADCDRLPCDGCVGSWRLQRVLGAGGMGTVYFGERENQGVRQQAAIKLLTLGHASEARRRFLDEQRMLARLHHPNIAHLIEGGVAADDTPYLALEYVEGVDLLTYANQRGLDAKARVRLFLDVCAAVEHAHQQLIVHRDIKPGNILVTGEGRVKLLDFGIGKLLDGLETVRDRTATGVRLFTLGYAAPEQLRGEAVSTVTDLYSMGVVLYKLLTGRLPFETSSNSAVDWERIVLTEEPAPPSRRINVDAPRLTTLAHAGGRAWRGDIDAIVLKALRREPAQRYGSVADLRNDLLALLDQRPVSARRGSRRYRLGKFVRRNALALGMGGIAAASLLAGLTVAVWQAREAHLGRAQAEESARRAEATVDFLTEVFSHADPAKVDGGNPTARDVLLSGERELRAAEDVDPATRTSLLIAMGRAYRGLGDGATYLRLMQDAQAPAAASSSPLLRIDALIHLAVALINEGQREQALAELQDAEALLDDGRLRDPVRQARIDYLYATTLNNLGREPEALSRIQRAHPVLIERLGAGSQQVALGLDVHVLLLRKLGRSSEGIEVTRPSVEAASRDAMPMERRALILDAHAAALLYANRPDEAEPFARQSLQLGEAVFGEQHADLIGSLSKLMLIQSRRGQHADALQIGDRLLAIRRRDAPAPSAMLSSTITSVAKVATEAREWALARQLLDEAITGFEAANAPLTSMRLRAWLLKSQVELAAGNLAESRQHLMAIAPHVDELPIDDRPVARRLLSEHSIAELKIDDP